MLCYTFSCGLPRFKMEQRDICQRSIPWLIGYEEAIIEVQSKKSSFAGDILAQSCTGPIFTYSCTYITLVCFSVVAIVQYVVCCPKFICVFVLPRVPLCCSVCISALSKVRLCVVQRAVCLHLVCIRKSGS